MKYLLIKTDEGIYTKDGKNYDILECNEAVGPRAGEFVEFESLEEALAFWHLT